MGDFGNNGFYRFDGGTERVLQHYRSGLNSIPTTEAFLANASDLYLLRLAAGSIGGVLLSKRGGANAMAFHSGPPAFSIRRRATGARAVQPHPPLFLSTTTTWLALPFCDVDGASAGRRRRRATCTAAVFLASASTSDAGVLRACPDPAPAAYRTRQPARSRSPLCRLRSLASRAGFKVDGRTEPRGVGCRRTGGRRDDGRLHVWCAHRWLWARHKTTKLKPAIFA